MASNPHQHTPGARPGEVSPIPVPSTPSTREAVPSPATPCDGGTATPLAPAAACPVCLDGPSSPPDERDAIFPCCGAYAHLSCILQCAHHHGQCPNCRDDLCQLLHDPGFTLRCEQAGLSLQPTALDGAQTAFTTVRDYSTRTFSRADAAEPSEPLHIRALCCPRLAGPAMGFLELPDRAMHWAPPTSQYIWHLFVDPHVDVHAVPARIANRPCTGPASQAKLSELMCPICMGGRHPPCCGEVGLQQVSLCRACSPTGASAASLLPQHI